MDIVEHHLDVRIDFWVYLLLDSVDTVIRTFLSQSEGRNEVLSLLCNALQGHLQRDMFLSSPRYRPRASWGDVGTGFELAGLERSKFEWLVTFAIEREERGPYTLNRRRISNWYECVYLHIWCTSGIGWNGTIFYWQISFLGGKIWWILSYADEPRILFSWLW
jgi:hypothetical protein